MVAAKSPDWLPSGWTVHIKVKNGRKIKCFSNQEIGRKFYSKNDVLSYVQTQNVQSDTTNPTNSKKNMSSKNKSSVAMKTDESPEWLPDGWTVKLKTRKSGSNMGAKYKCYIDPEAGHKFYSKPEVLQYLKTSKLINCTDKRRKRANSSCDSDDITEKSSSEPVESPHHITKEDKSFVSDQNTTLKNKLSTKDPEDMSFVSDKKTTPKNKRSTKDVVIVTASPDGLKLEEIAPINNVNGIKKDLAAMKTNETPEWLPDGWTMELKTRKTGSHMGSKYKCYIDPEAGRKFYSKPEVLQHRKSVKHSNCKSRRKKRGNSSCNSDGTREKSSSEPVASQDHKNIEDKSVISDQKTTRENECHAKDVVIMTASSDGLHSEEVAPIKRVNGMKKDLVSVKMDKTPEWLPDGWTMELKTRKTGSHMGSKYKCYIDPEAGHKFYSKPEVLQYLKTVNQSNCKTKRNQRGASPDNIDGETRGKYSSEPAGYLALKTMEDNNFTSDQKTMDNDEHSTKDVFVATSPDGLPPGWIKEVKPRKYAKGIKMDPYYKDPVSGYMFRSKLDVLRYLETGDINRCAIRPKKRDDNDLDKINNDIPSQSAVDKKKLRQGTRRRLFAGKKNSETSSLSAPEAIYSKKRKASESNQDKMMLAENESVSTHSNRKTQVSGGRSKNRKALSPPTQRLSKRHAGLNSEMLTDLSERATRAGVKKSAEVAVIPSFNLAPDSAANETVHQLETEPGSEIPQHSSRGKELPSESKPLNSSNFFLEDQAVSPKFTGRETEKQDFKIRGSRELPFSYTSGDSLSDPCLEFAFSLTGAMQLSVEENVGTRGFSQQQHDPVQSDVCIELPKFDFQNDVSFDLDSTEECLPIQQLPANPVSQPSCSSIESQQPSWSTGVSNWKPQ